MKNLSSKVKQFGQLIDALNYSFETENELIIEAVESFYYDRIVETIEELKDFFPEELYDSFKECNSSELDIYNYLSKKLHV